MSMKSIDAPRGHAAGLRKDDRLLFWGCCLLLAALYAAKPFIHVAPGEDAHLASYSDDFFYYLVIAENFVNGHFSTFDSLHQTNGYHPLWMAVLTAVSAVIDPHDPGYFLVLQGLTALLGLLTIHLSLRLGADVMRLEPAVARTTALVVGLLYFRYATMGMEINLAIPLVVLALLAFFRCLEVPSGRRALWLALAISAAVLARIDSAILFAVLVPVVFVHVLRHDRSRLSALLDRRTVAMGAMGLAPVGAYLLFNQLHFATALPVSAQAKQLAGAAAPSFDFVHAGVIRPVLLLLRGEVTYPLTDVALPALLLALRALWLVGGMALGQPHRPGNVACRILETGILLWIVLFYSALAMLSDWALWDWYWYPLVIATLVSLPPVLRWLLARLPALTETRTLALAAVPLVAFSAYSLAGPPDLSAYRAARAVAGFADGHPGIYGQGDLAGLVAFLTKRPVVQLEGLVGDVGYLDYLRRRAPLEEALADYGIDYYIGTRMELRDGCHVAVEPKPMQAGARSPHMEGRFCAAPVFQCCDAAGPGYRIFDVAPHLQKPRQAW